MILWSQWVSNLGYIKRDGPGDSPKVQKKKVDRLAMRVVNPKGDLIESIKLKLHGQRDSLLCKRMGRSLRRESCKRKESLDRGECEDDDKSTACE